MFNNAPSQKNVRTLSRIRGVLIVEMLAAFAIVSVTMVIVADSFISANKGNASSQRAVEVADALAYVLADMTREAKVSNTFTWTTDTFSMTRVAGLNNQTADAVSYRLQVDSGVGRIYKQVVTTELPITPTLLNITSFIVGLENDDGVRRAIVTMQATHARAKVGEPPVYIHTTLAERF